MIGYLFSRMYYLILCFILFLSSINSFSKTRVPGAVQVIILVKSRDIQGKYFPYATTTIRTFTFGKGF